MTTTLDTDTSGKRIWGLNPNVFFLGVVSLLTDISSEMIFTLVPLFLSNVLGAATTIIGLIGGLSESVDAILRIFSGWFSDRVGKGIRTSPRDALVADSVLAGERGKGFGLHRAMDTFGAVLGLTIAAIIIFSVQGGGLQLSLKSYQWLVLVGVAPAVLGVLALLIFVREAGRKPLLSSSSHQGFAWNRLTSGFDTRFKVFLAIMAVFTLGNSSDFFVILRAHNVEAPLFQVVLMLVLFHATYAVTSLPAGMLSDKLGRRRVITLGWFIYALVYLGFALASSLWQVWLLFACYGLYYGIVEGVARAFVADLVVEEKRGTAYGFYHGVVGLTLLPASLIAGWLWQAISPAAPFFFGAGLAFVAMLGLMGLVRE